jgi:peptidoglycan/xylan/chitin deacetylase (PgdA/CDA1 family)
LSPLYESPQRARCRQTSATSGSTATSTLPDPQQPCTQRPTLSATTSCSAPTSTDPGRLLTHELVHAGQRAADPAYPVRHIADNADPAEREASMIAAESGERDGSSRPSATRRAGTLYRTELLTASGAAPAIVEVASSLRKTAATMRIFSLTFDDGPHIAELGIKKNRTEKVLDTLKARGIRAGFFIQTGVSFRGASAIGRQLVQRMHAEGHTVGVHTGGKTDHELHPDAQTAGRLGSELSAAKSYISEQTGRTPAFVRPPKGKFDSAVSLTYKKAGLTNLLWDIDGDEGANKSRAELVKRVRKGVEEVAARTPPWKGKTPLHPKIVVLHHDIQAGTADNLDAIIDEIKQATNDVSSGKDRAEFAPP